MSLWVLKAVIRDNMGSLIGDLVPRDLGRVVSI